MSRGVPFWFLRIHPAAARSFCRALQRDIAAMIMYCNIYRHPIIRYCAYDTVNYAVLRTDITVLHIYSLAKSIYVLDFSSCTGVISSGAGQAQLASAERVYRIII